MAQSHARIDSAVQNRVAELESAITAYVEHHNASPHGFRWMKSANGLLAKVTRARAALNKAPSG